MDVRALLEQDLLEMTEYETHLGDIMEWDLMDLLSMGNNTETLSLARLVTLEGVVEWQPVDTLEKEHSAQVV